MTEEVGLAILITAGWLLMFRYRAEDLGAALAQFESRERRWAQIAPVVIGAHVTLCCLFLNWADTENWRVVLAGIVFAAAVAFWFVGRAQIGPLRQTRLPSEPPLTLRSDGAFAVVRHPLFLAYLMAGAAPLIAVAHAWLGLTFAGCVLVIIMRTLQEERRLHRQLGAEYRAYCRAVKRLVPFVW